MNASPPSLVDAVHVWRIDLDRREWVTASALSDAERARAERITPGARRQRWASSRRALRSVLAGYLDRAPGSIEFTLGDNGKPGLPGRAPEFNLSHADGTALIAVSEVAVGIDLERREPRRDFVALAEHGLDSPTVDMLRTSPASDRAMLFYAAWCRKEAIAKCGGGGLVGPAPEFPLTVTDLDAGPGWVAALAVAGAVREIRFLEAVC